MLMLFAERLWLAVTATVLVGVSFTAHGQTDIREIFQTELACAVVEPLLADLSVEPLFEQHGTECTSVVPDDSNDRTYYADSSCTTVLPYAPTSLTSYCARLLDATGLGEGQGISGSSTWTLPPGTRFDVGARSLDNLHQPYLQRRIYQSVETASGTCSLEMRIYAKHPSVTAQRSLLALHGGSWSARGFGFFGLELTIPHFVEQGFVVYAPFYRLLGDSEGSAACRNATITDVNADASAALSWVRQNAENYGSAPVPVVFGQSAGAHLATSLVVNEADSVAAAVLFYPPTDFTDFTLRAREGFYTNDQGLSILSRVIQTTAQAADVSASPIAENSFPIQIAEGALSIPPVLMVHGMADELVEARQSVRLCDALAGRPLLPTDTEPASIANLRQVIPCGADSQLQLIREGQHALDVCFADTLIPTDLCPSGSDASRIQVAQAIAEATVFAATSAPVGNGGAVTPIPADPDEGASSSSGGSLCYLSLLLCGVVLAFRRRHGNMIRPVALAVIPAT